MGRKETFADKQRKAESSKLERNASDYLGSNSKHTFAKTATVAGLALAAAKVADAAIIYSFRDLMDLSDIQSVRNYDSSYNITGEFTDNGETPTEQNYDFGGFSDVEGGAIVSAYMDNNDFLGAPGYLNGIYDREHLGVGGRPDWWMAVQKNALFEGTPYIGETVGGSLNIASGNNVWLNGFIEYDGVAGASIQMPGCTDSGTLEIQNSINLVPEPTTMVTLGLMGAAALGGRVKRFFSKKKK